MSKSRPAPCPYDPQLLDALGWFKSTFEPIPLLPHTIAENRAILAGITPSLAASLEGHDGVRSSERVAAGPRGEIALTILEPADGSLTADPATPSAADPANPSSPASATSAPTSPAAAVSATLRGSDAASGSGPAGVGQSPPRPAVLVIHGGGLVLGDRFFAAGEGIGLVERYGAVAVLVEYRLAPEFPGSAPVEDCYAALQWLAANAGELNVDPDRMVVSGFSAGGGLSAGVALMARDLGGPALAGQLLGCPMLDDRDESVSTRQYDGIGVWDRTNNRTAWDAVLGERPHRNVSRYAAPSRAADLSGLPPAFIDVGGAEVFRDEAVEYASRIWATGGSAELHVWDGGFHGFAGFAPQAQASLASAVATDSWWRRVLKLDGGKAA